MWRIELSNIDGDKLITSFTTTVETLVEAEIVARGEVGVHIGKADIRLIHIDNLIYGVTDGVGCLGLVSIRPLSNYSNVRKGKL